VYLGPHADTRWMAPVTEIAKDVAGIENISLLIFLPTLFSTIEIFIHR